MNNLMQVRQAAKVLGVHENTVRRWEERGLLRAIRLPSGVRRLDADDVQALRSRIYDGMPAVHAGMDDDIPSVQTKPVDD